MENKQLSHLLHLQEASNQGRLVIFVGAGVSANSGIPTWNTLISELKKDLNIDDETDPLRVSQIYKNSRGDKEYMDKVKRVLKYKNALPNPIHKAMLDLNPCHFITTNFDDTIEQEVRNEFKQYAIVSQDKDIPNMDYPNAIIKMHGDYASDNIVLTEKDYFDYAQNFPLIRSFVLSLFASKTIMFVGFSFSDYNLNVILNDVKRILQEKMQRVYLVTSLRRDGDWDNYFINKGVNMVNPELSEIEQYVANDELYKELTNSEGKYVYSALRAIKMCKPKFDGDFIDVLYQKICSLRNEIKTLGKGMKYLFPSDEKRVWIQHSDGIRINSTSLNKVKKEVNSKSAIRNFLREHPNIDANTLRQIAKDNYLFNIDDIQLLQENDYNFNGFFSTHTSLSQYFSFDLDVLSETLCQYRVRGIKADISDLEYPFLLYKLGDFIGAYNIYNDILPIAWGKHRYILYFISLYNIWSIRFSLYMQLQHRGDQKDAQKTLSRIEKINLSQVLERLPIEDAYKCILKVLLSYDDIGETTVKTEYLCDNLHKQRKSAEKGGWAINSNIVSLLATFEREFLFCYNNYIIRENSKYFDSIVTNSIIGILNSISTPDNNAPIGCSKMHKLNEMSIVLIVFFFSAGQLNAIFRQYEIEKLPIEPSAVKMINTWLSNIKETKNDPYVYNVFADELFTRIESLLNLLPQLDTHEITTALAFDIIIKYWGKLNTTVIHEAIIYKLICYYKPEETMSMNLLGKIIYNSEFERFEYTIEKLVCYMYGDKLVFKIKDKSILDNSVNMRTLYKLYPILEKEIQDEYLQTILESFSSLHKYLEFVICNEILVQSTIKFESLMEKDFKENNKHITLCCQELVTLYKRGDEKINSIIDSWKEKSEILNFYFNPKDYLQSESVKFDWIIYNMQRDELLKHEKYKNIVKEHILNSYKHLSKGEIIKILKDF